MHDIEKLANNIGAKLLPIILKCSNDALRERISSESRVGTYKIQDPEYGIKRIQNKKLLIPRNALIIETSDLDVNQIIKIILNKVASSDF